jgi:hypothetical protein
LLGEVDEGVNEGGVGYGKEEQGRTKKLKKRVNIV